MKGIQFVLQRIDLEIKITMRGAESAHNQHVSKKHNIHKDIGDYRIEIKPKITEKDMNEMFPDRKLRFVTKSKTD